MNRLRAAASKLVSNKVFLMVTSVVIAFIVWLYIVNGQNEDITIELLSIPLRYEVDDSQLDARNLMVANTDTSTVNLKIRGKRNQVSHINRTMIDAVVDLNKINGSGTQYCVIDIVLPEEAADITVTERVPEIAVVQVESIVKKQIAVRGSLEGSVGDGYIKETMKFTPASLTIRGPSAQVAEIDHAWVTVVQDNVMESIAATVEPELRKSNGDPASTDNIKLDVDSVMVELPIKMQKEVALTINLVPGGGASINNASFEIKPSTVLLKGDAAELAELNTLAPLDTIDLSTVNGKVTRTVPIRIPDGMDNLSGEHSAEVTVTIIGLMSSPRVVTNFRAENTAPGYSVKFITNTLLVTIRGPADEVESIRSENITVVCDISDIAHTTGMHELDPENITISIAGSNSVGVIRNYSRVSIEIVDE
ncbi:MAG: hypothetical protein LBC65_00325 [Oscillospiraceae bacterium]|jgi:hypothetical protein|nr:hypothetical protein [Oscillospiraceae bacterium]